MIQQTDNTDSRMHTAGGPLMMGIKVMKNEYGSRNARPAPKGRGRCLFCILLLPAGIPEPFVAANTGIRHAEGFCCPREWMYETRYGWLI